jgi:uncharacterized protein involved in exopolysaccharide biosynthesis
VNHSPMNIADLFHALYSRRLLLCVLFFTIVGAGMIVTFLLPPTYESTMKILVARDRIDPQVTPADKGSDVVRSEYTAEEFNSEMEILQSRTVVESVVRQLGLDKQDAPGWLARLIARLGGLYQSFHRQATPDATERAVRRLTERLEVFSVKNSRIIKVTYRDRNPERAAQVLNELYRQYGEHHLRLRQNSRAANVFHEQSVAFSQRLAEATGALKHFDAKNGVAANTTQRNLLLEQFQKVQADLDKARTEFREAEHRIAALKTQLESQPERIESEARTKYVAARDKMKDEILMLELQRTQLLQKYQPNHRLVKDVEERLAQARELLAREEQSPPQERTTVLNDVHRRLTNELLTTQANLTTLGEREQSLAALADRYKRLVARFDMKSIERVDLERERAVNEEAYLLYHKKAQETDIVNALNQERVVNFSLAEAPSANRRPVSPKPLINLAVLVVVGLMAAVAIVAFLERNRARLGEDGLPAAIHVGSFPLPDRNRALSPRAAMLLQSGDQPEGNGHRLLADRNYDKSSPGQVGAPTNVGGANDPAQDDSIDDEPEAWRVEAVVDYLHRVYHLPSGKLSEVLLETTGWKISPEVIDKIFSRAAKRADRDKAVTSIDS